MAEKVASCKNDKLIAKVASRKSGKVAKWQVNEMSIWQKRGIMEKRQVNSKSGKLMKRLVDKMTNRQKGILEE